MDYYPFQHSQLESDNGDRIVLQKEEFSPPERGFHANDDLDNVKPSFNSRNSPSGLV